MKKTTTMATAVLFALFLASCSSATGGNPTGEALLKFMPKTTRGVITVDVHRVMTTEAAVKALQEPKAKQKYDEFVKMSGIDPMKDVYFIGVGLTGSPTSKVQEGGAIINLKYNKDKLLAVMKEKAPEFRTESYNGLTIYSNLDGSETKQTTRAAFLDETHIVIGSEAGIKSIIDVRQKKADSLIKSPDMVAILKTLDKTAMVWGAFCVPPDLIKKGIESSPQLKVLEGVTALTMSFDYRLSKLIADIRTMGGTKDQNANLASTLNGLKGLGAMMGGKEPAFGEFLNAIEITSGQDFVKLYFSVSQDLMDKLGKAAQSRVGDLVKIKKDEPKSEEKK
jgi:hypothetical protein